jgi:hypothetical protein
MKFRENRPFAGVDAAEVDQTVINGVPFGRPYREIPHDAAQ